jgi:hypothetical protein
VNAKGKIPVFEQKIEHMHRTRQANSLTLTALQTCSSCFLACLLSSRTTVPHGHRLLLASNMTRVRVFSARVQVINEIKHTIASGTTTLTILPESGRRKSRALACCQAFSCRPHLWCRQHSRYLCRCVAHVMADVSQRQTLRGPRDEQPSM